MDPASIGFITYGMNAIWLLIALAVLVVLLRLYAQTQMSGFLWLLFAVVVWPFLARGVSIGLPMYVAQRGLPTDHLLMLTLGTAAIETVLGVLLLLVSVLVLQRQISARMLWRQPVAPGVPSATGLPPY